MTARDMKALQARVEVNSVTDLLREMNGSAAELVMA